MDLVEIEEISTSTWRDRLVGLWQNPIITCSLGVLVGLAAGLLASIFLLTRLNYLSQVEKVALLSRLLLSKEELDRMTRQLGDILGYIDLLSELDTEKVPKSALPIAIQIPVGDETTTITTGTAKATWRAPFAF